MKAYADLATLKSDAYIGLETTDTDNDVQLRKLLEQSTIQLDKYTRRFFNTREETRFFDGVDWNIGSRGILFLPVDLLSVGTLKTDEDGDGTYENTFASTDFHLYPLNDFPKTRIELNRFGDQTHFAAGVQKGVEIVGVFGHGDGLSATPFFDSGNTTNGELDATETGVTVSATTGLAIGHTIRVESEQMYIQSISALVLTVRRGVNGTTAATHTTGQTVNIYEYPAPIFQACLIMTMRAWERKDSAYQDIVGNPELGTLIASKGIDPDVAETVKQYVKYRGLFA